MAVVWIEDCVTGAVCVTKEACVVLVGINSAPANRIISRVSEIRRALTESVVLAVEDTWQNVGRIDNKLLSSQTVRHPNTSRVSVIESAELETSLKNIHMSLTIAC